MARFNNNMFQDEFAYEDFDRTGIMDPGMADVIEMRKEANEARQGATDQYTADVADFKNTQATEAEQGIASLPNAPSMPTVGTPYTRGHTGLGGKVPFVPTEPPPTAYSGGFLNVINPDATGVAMYTNDPRRQYYLQGQYDEYLSLFDKLQQRGADYGRIAQPSPEQFERIKQEKARFKELYNMFGVIGTGGAYTPYQEGDARPTIEEMFANEVYSKYAIDQPAPTPSAPSEPQTTMQVWNQETGTFDEVPIPDFMPMPGTTPPAVSPPEGETLPTTTAQNYFNPTLFGYDVNLPDNITAEDFQFEDIDMTGMVPDVPVYTNPYVDVFTPAPAPAPVVTLPDLGLYDYNNNVFEPEPTPYTPPVSNDTGETTPYVPPDDLPDYPFVDPETGGDIVFVPGTPVNPGPGVVVTDPVTGELPDGYIPGGGDGPAGTIPPEVFVPAPTPAPIMNPYTNRAVKNPYRPFEQPSSPVDEYIRPMDPAEFGSAPGMNQGGRVPMGNNNILNSGLSRLPLNQQNDTLTQVFQSGFRPRR